ncbi:MAG TPA: hypothetical protein VLL48_05125 [Longimicrobiales bacterium]|nr:hypothetical protein [Longimicrobiales bacterium]
MNDRVKTLLEGRREKMARSLGRPMTLPRGHESPLEADARAHLLEDAEDLYWNELEWENITAEEETAGGPLVQLTFPGLLAFVRGLLLEQTMPDALAPAEPRPEVVEEVARFLARRVVELEEALSAGDVEEPDRVRAELTLTDGLIDHVLYELHDVTDDEIERLEAAQVQG